MNKEKRRKRAKAKAKQCMYMRNEGTIYIKRFQHGKYELTTKGEEELPWLMK
ncbi:hypothetical protein ES703_37879 [subsurface metagenome]